MSFDGFDLRVKRDIQSKLGVILGEGMRLNLRWFQTTEKRVKRRSG